MTEEIVHYRAASDHVVTICNRRVDSLPADAWSDAPDDVKGCPACRRHLGNVSQMSQCDHGPTCECYGMGYRTAWEYLHKDIIFAAEQDPEDCGCYSCQLVRALGHHFEGLGTP